MSWDAGGNTSRRDFLGKGAVFWGAAAALGPSQVLAQKTEKSP